MNDLLNLPDLRKAARFLLASSVKNTFPEAKLAGGGTTPLGFYYDFVFPFEFQQAFLSLLEEGMKRLIKEKIEFDVREMVPFSAKELLHFKNEPLRAEDAEQSEASLVTIIHIDSFIDLCEDDLACANTEEVGAIKLKSFEKIGKRHKKDVIRIWGAASFDKQSLKQFLKEEESLVQRCHPVMGEKLQLFKPANSEGSLWLWAEKGAALLRKIVSWQNDELAKENFSFLVMPSPDAIAFVEDIEDEPISPDLLLERAELASLFNLKKVAERCSFWNKELTDFSAGLLKTLKPNFDIQYIFTTEKLLFDECISSLLFISKMLKILGFEYKIILSVRKVKPSALTNDERICAEALRKAVRTLQEVSIQEQTHSTFKGVKLEFRINDALGREWTTGFMHVSYMEKGPVIIRSTLGSQERIVALMLEKHEGLSSLFK